MLRSLLMGWKGVLTAAAGVLSLLVPASTHAEIVVLTSGRTLTVQSYAVDGDLVTFQMRGGGEITCTRDVIDRILPDEVRPSPEPAQGAEPGATRVDAPVAAAVRSSPYSDIIL